MYQRIHSLALRERVRRLLISAIFLVSLGCTPNTPARAAATLELYGTFHAMGVIVSLDAADDPDQDAAASLSYRPSGGGAYRAGYPLTRISATRFVGSMFWLTPGATYDVRVTFADPDGGALNGGSVEGSAATRAEIAIPTPSAAYYASPAGSGNTCSIAAPCALTTAIDLAQPGQEVVLRGGVYYQGDLTLPRSGASGAPIVIKGHPGETAILDGADPANFTWASQGGGVYATTVNVAGPHLLIANGQRLLPYTSLADLQSLRWGKPGFYASGTTVYARLAGDADPNTATIVVSRYNTGVTVSRNFIYFLNLTFRHYGQGDYAKAVYFFNGNDNLVQGSTFVHNDLSVGLKYDAHRNVIQDNTFSDSIFDWPWDAFYDGINLSSGGIRFYGPTDGRGNVIRRNTFHDLFDGFGGCPGSKSDTALTNETDIYENLVYNAGDDGMETDGECSNVRIWGNTFHDVLAGVSLAPAYTGPTYAIRNLIYRTGVGNNNYSGISFKFNSGYDTSGPMYLFHNTADAFLTESSDGGNNGFYVKSPGTWRMIYARNNIWAGTAYAMNNANASQPIDLDYDNLWRDTSGDLARWSGVNHATLSSFTGATGQETRGLNVAPNFANRNGGDYTLAAGSALIDAGIALPGVNDGFVGAAPDIGAFEYQGYGFTLTVTPRSRTAAPGAAATYTLDLRPIGAFSGDVTLAAANPSPMLTTQITPASVTLPGQATLTITNSHTGATMLPGTWYDIPITAASGGSEQTASASLLVGGARVCLAVVRR